MRASSLEAWAGIREQLPQRRRELLELILQFPGRTAMQLEVAAGGCGLKSWRHLSKRFSELQRQNLITAEENGTAPIRWWPKAQVPLELEPLPRKVPRAQLEHVYAVANRYVASRTLADFVEMIAAVEAVSP